MKRALVCVLYVVDGFVREVDVKYGYVFKCMMAFD